MDCSRTRSLYHSSNQSTGTFIANDYVALTNAAVVGAVFSMTAAVTLTVSAVRVPSAGVRALSGPAYNTPVNMLSAGSFTVFGGVGIVNTGPSAIVGNVGVYPGACVDGGASLGFLPCRNF